VHEDTVDFDGVQAAAAAGGAGGLVNKEIADTILMEF